MGNEKKAAELTLLNAILNLCENVLDQYDEDDNLQDAKEHIIIAQRQIYKSESYPEDD